jgi:aminomethyltransferase
VIEANAAPRKTPLHDEHVALGARMVDFAGWAMPVQYASILAEHQAVRTQAGLFDVSHMGEVEISGPAAEALCAKLFTNDARTLEPGKAQYSMIANEDGGVVDDIIVYRLAADRFLVCVNASNAAKDLAWIRDHAIDGATIEDRSDAMGLIAIQGPHAVRAVEELSPGISSMKRFTCALRTVAGVEVLAARTGYTGEDGFELFCPADATVPLWRALLATEAAPQPCGLGARDTLRVEAALPLYGHELGPDISPYEVGLGWAVKRNRPEMIGYAALERAAAGGTKRRLVGFHVDGGIAREGAPVFPVGAAEPAGKVTSGTHSPTLGRAVALALVDRSAAEPFEVELRGKRRAVAVTSLPFCVKRAAS